jgi:hypothetical protein
MLNPVKWYLKYIFERDTGEFKRIEREDNKLKPL